jgi:predicted nicotinamide N-methyase
MPPPTHHPTPATTEVAVGDMALRLARPPSAEDLIDEDAYAIDERLPYWAELWPSARVLAGALAVEPLEGLRVLELGCGLGLPSIVALARGATVLATDWYEDALAFAERNAEAAVGRRLATMLVDWRDPPAQLLESAPFDLVMAADVLYEERNAAALAPVLPQLVGPASRLWIADPRRPHAALLWPHLEARGWRHTKEDVTLDAHIDEAGPVVHLHRWETTRDTALRMTPGSPIH